MRSVILTLLAVMFAVPSSAWAAETVESQNLCARALAARMGPIDRLLASQFPSSALERLIRAQYMASARRQMEERGERFITISEFSRGTWALMGVADQAIRDLNTQIDALRRHGQENDGASRISAIIVTNLQGSQAHRFMMPGSSLDGLSPRALLEQLQAARRRAQDLWSAGRTDLYWVKTLTQGRNVQSQGVGAARWAPLWVKKMVLGGMLTVGVAGAYHVAAPVLAQGATEYANGAAETMGLLREELYDFVTQPLNGVAPL